MGRVDRLFSWGSGESLCYSAVCKSEPKKRQVRSPLACVHALGGRVPPPRVLSPTSGASLQVFAPVTLPSPSTRALSPPLLLFSPSFIVPSDKGVAQVTYLFIIPSPPPVLAPLPACRGALSAQSPALGGECIPCPDDLTTPHTTSLLTSTGAVGSGCIGLQILDLPSQPLSDRT